MALPRKLVVPTVRQDVEIDYPHRDPIVISPVAFEPGPALLARTSDWAIDIAMHRGAERNQWQATVAHGSPYAWFTLSRGDLRVRLPAAADRLAATTRECWRCAARARPGRCSAPRAWPGSRCPPPNGWPAFRLARVTCLRRGTARRKPRHAGASERNTPTALSRTRAWTGRWAIPDQ